MLAYPKRILVYDKIYSVKIWDDLRTVHKMGFYNQKRYSLAYDFIFITACLKIGYRFFPLIRLISVNMQSERYLSSNTLSISISCTNKDLEIIVVFC